MEVDTVVDILMEVDIHMEVDTVVDIRMEVDIQVDADTRPPTKVKCVRHTARSLLMLDDLDSFFDQIVVFIIYVTTSLSLLRIKDIAARAGRITC